MGTDILRFLGLIIVTRSQFLLKWHLLDSFSLLKLFIVGLSINFIKTTFLHGDLEENVYMEDPLGFVAKGELSTMVCRLQRSPYGIKEYSQA